MKRIITSLLMVAITGLVGAETRSGYCYTTRSRSIPWVSERTAEGVDLRYRYQGPVEESDLMSVSAMMSTGKSFVIFFTGTDWNEVGAQLLPIYRTWRDEKRDTEIFGATSIYDWPEVDTPASTKSRSSSIVGSLYCLTASSASGREHIWPAIGVYNAEGKLYAFFNALEVMSVEELNTMLTAAHTRYEAYLEAKAAAEAATDDTLNAAALAGELGLRLEDGEILDAGGRKITLEIYKAALLGQGLVCLEPNVYKLGFLNSSNRMGAAFSQIKTWDPNDVSGALHRTTHDEYFSEGLKIATTADYVPTSEEGLAYTADRMDDTRLVKKSDNQKQQGLLCGTILWKKNSVADPTSLGYARDAIAVNPSSFWGIAARGRVLMGGQGPVLPWSQGWSAYHLTVPTDARAAQQDGLTVTQDADGQLSFAWLMRYGTDMRLNKRGWYTVTLTKKSGVAPTFSQIKIWQGARSAAWDTATQSPTGATLVFDGSQAVADQHAPNNGDAFATFSGLTYPVSLTGSQSFTFYLPETTTQRLLRYERDATGTPPYDDICIQIVGTAEGTSTGTITINPVTAPIALATPIADTIQVDDKTLSLADYQATLDAQLTAKEPVVSPDGEATAKAVLAMIDGETVDADYVKALDQNELLRQVGIGDNAMKAAVTQVKYGKEALEAILADPVWLAEMIQSGPYLPDVSASLAIQRMAQLWAVDELYVKDHPETVRGALAAAPGTEKYDALLRRMATALVLNYTNFVGGDTFITRDGLLIRDWQVYRNFMDRGLLHGDFFTQTAYQLRYAVNPRAFSPAELEFAVKTTNSHLNQINGGAWQTNYRINNFFGDSIFGSDYTKPWTLTEMPGYAVGRLVGSVCGGISHYGVLAANSSGRRSITGGQPGHCAAMHRSFSGNKWDIDSNVSAPTGNHRPIWSELGYYQSMEYMDDMFDDPTTVVGYRLLAAAKLRERRNGWQDPAVEALYRQAVTSGPLTYEAFKAYATWLQAHYPNDIGRWLVWSDKVTMGLWRYPRIGWQLIQGYLTTPVQQALGENGLLAVYRQLNRRMPMSDRATGEQYQYKERVLTPQSGYFTSDELQLAWLETLLDTHYGTSLFNQALNWGTSKFGSTSTQFNQVLNDVYEANGVQDGLKSTVYSAILGYTQAGDIASLRAMYNLYEVLYEGEVKKNTNAPLYSQTLLSANGLLVLSKYHYRTSDETLDASVSSYIMAHRVIDNAAFSTYAVWTEPDTEAAWMMVQLPGDSEVYGIVLQNGETEVAVDVELSDDATTWKTIALNRTLAANAIVTIDSDGSSITRFVRVRRQNTSGQQQQLKLQKFQVFGVPRY